MKALIIGGNRFFGKRLAAGLLQRKVSVTLLNRGQHADGFGANVERIQLDRQTLHRNHPLLAGLEWDIVYDQVCYDATEARAACEAFAGKTGSYVFTSSQSVYAPGAALTEDAFQPRNHVFTSVVDRFTDYGEAKRQAEAVFFREAPFPVTAVRFPFVLGDDDYTGRIQFHVEHILESRPLHFPNIDARISLISSADAARFLEFLASRPIPGPINCCSPEPISFRELVETIEAATGRRAKLEGEASADPSPYGVASDWFMNVDKLRQYGFVAEPLMSWLRPLVEGLAKDR